MTREGSRACANGAGARGTAGRLGGIRTVDLAACLALIVGAVACGVEATSAPETAQVTAPPGQILPSASEAERGRFLLGRAVFERLATPEEGLGPLFNATRCSDCHDQPAVGGSGVVFVHKATRFDGGACDPLRELGGSNLQQRVTPALAARGFGPEPVPERATHRSTVRPTQLFGLGLLEAVTDATIEAGADSADADGDGVSGRVGRDGAGRVGRFGWKADHATIADFVDEALRFELGFTTPRVPREETHGGTPLPAVVDPMPEPEIDEAGVGLLVDYLRGLAVPVGAVSSPGAETGGDIFLRIGCAACHTPSLPIGRDVQGVPAGSQIPAFTDLLLHDMGPEAEGVCGPAAGPQEYRTPPLWGVGLRPLLLHDGSVSTLDSAIERHGGEGSAAARAFAALDPSERERLLAYLRSL